jgi:exosortase/archaeosortase family protein
LNGQFSLIILTYNEELHLPRLLRSVAELDAPIFILDSGSTDNTLNIAAEYNAVVLNHAFENHPKQWDFALKNFDIKTPWVICLDADQVVTPELKAKLLNFKDEDYKDIDGIYFNRKNYFKGRWIKHGGYSPFYLLKMIRFGVGYSDLNENMDHRFIVPGKTVVWKDGYIVEENLKENNIKFWIDKHNRYSDLVAAEEVERMLNLRTQTLKPNFWGSPDERTARFKQLWWQLPRYTRPILYFIYRMFFQLGILDGREGVIFHFLQAYWFRLIVDVKIDEILKYQHPEKYAGKEPVSPLGFVFKFLGLFLLFYFFNLLFFGLTSPGKHYSPFLDHYLNYVQGLRWLLLNVSTGLLNMLGFTAICNDYELLVAGHSTIQVVYSCLGLGVISFFAAFVLAFPKPVKRKMIFLVTGILVIEFLNVIRFMVLVLYWTPKDSKIIDHHTIFNVIIYIIIAISLYFWVKHPEGENKRHAAN